ncbi:MAG: hypothetical protein WA672_09075 [Candidatus Angelobacter sp.]
MSAFSRETLETIASWSEIFGGIFGLLAAASVIAYLLASRPLRKIEALESLQEKQKTALAQKEAAEAQLALRRNIEYAATPRRIVLGSRNNDQEIREVRFKELEKYAGTTAIILFVNDGDAKLLAFDIKAALLKSGWKANVEEAPVSIPLGYIESGVHVRTLEKVEAAEGQVSLSEPPKIKAIVDLLRLDLTEPYGPFTGVTWRPDVIRNGEVMGLTRYGVRFPEGGVVITVGRKPVEDFLWTHDAPKPAPTK